MQSDDLTGV
ncbi:hypothetical protein D037_4625A, partial [Vibrio parahaemolyticus IDH02640]